jgi:predicted nuclease of predicted toxin-antitoxin system
MMRFVVDANLPPDLARLLKQLGHDASHVYRFGLEGTRDNLIWQKAKELNGVIVSKDYDFVMMHQRDQSVSVIYYNRGNIKKSELLAHFSSIMPEIVSALNVGETLIEIT